MLTMYEIIKHTCIYTDDGQAIAVILRKQGMKGIKRVLDNFDLGNLRTSRKKIGYQNFPHKAKHSVSTYQY